MTEILTIRDLALLYAKVWQDRGNERGLCKEHLPLYKHAKKMCWKSFRETHNLQDYLDTAVLDKAIALMESEATHGKEL